MENQEKDKDSPSVAAGIGYLQVLRKEHEEAEETLQPIVAAEQVLDPYINALIKLARSTVQERMIDRLLIFSIVEGRGCERFFLLSQALPEGPLKDMYIELVRSESRHHTVGVRLVKELFPDSNWESRYNELLEQEAQIVSQLPFRAALH